MTRVSTNSCSWNDATWSINFFCLYWTTVTFYMNPNTTAICRLSKKRYSGFCLFLLQHQHCYNIHLKQQLNLKILDQPCFLMPGLENQEQKVFYV